MLTWVGTPTQDAAVSKTHVPGAHPDLLLEPSEHSCPAVINREAWTCASCHPPTQSLTSV